MGLCELMVLYIGILTNFVNLLVTNKLEIFINKGIEKINPFIFVPIKGKLLKINPFDFILFVGLFIFLTIYIWINDKNVLHLQQIK